MSHCLTGKLLVIAAYNSLSAGSDGKPAYKKRRRRRRLPAKRVMQ